jgi:hypothetical protein
MNSSSWTLKKLCTTTRNLDTQSQEWSAALDVMERGRECVHGAVTQSWITQKLQGFHGGGWGNVTNGRREVAQNAPVTQSILIQTQDLFISIDEWIIRNDCRSTSPHVMLVCVYD